MSGGPRHSGAPDGAEGPGTEHRHCSPPSAGGHLEPYGVGGAGGSANPPPAEETTQ
jgi:hypothetical protein